MKFMTKKVKITLLVLLLAVVGFASTKLVSAWLTDTASNEVKLTVGKVDYTMSVAGTDSTPIVPGQSLLKAFTIANNSTVSSNFRFKVEVSTEGSLTDPLTIVYDTVNWTLDADGYYYYGGKDLTESTNDDIATTTKSLNAPVTSITLNGSTTDNSYAEKTITITFTFEAKQAEYVNWTGVTSFIQVDPVV